MALEIKATLRVFSEDYSLSELSKLLGKPSKGFSNGDKFSSGKKTRDISFWSFETTHVDPRESLDNHLSEIIQYVEGRTEAFSKLKKSNCKIDITCMLDSDNGQGGARLSINSMKCLSELGLDLSFDVYADCE